MLKQYGLCAMLFLFMISVPFVSKSQGNQTVNPGATVAASVFPVGTCTYTWTNDQPSIGLAISGTGNIASFRAVNNTSLPVTATITATPVPTSYAYIPNSGSNNVSVINTNTGIVETTIDLLPIRNPVAVAVSPDGKEVYLANAASNSISYINTATNTAGSFTGGSFRSPSGVASTPDGKYMYVTNSGGSKIMKVNRQAHVIDDITVGQNPIGVVVSPDGNKVYVVNNSSNSISVVSTVTDVLLNTISIGSSPYFIAITPDGKYLYITHTNLNTVSVVNTTTNTLLKVINVGLSPNGITASQDGSRIYVANKNSSTLSVISTATNTVTNTITIDNPTGLSLSPDGSLLYVTDNLGGKVNVLKTSDFTIVSSITVGSGPFSVGNFITPGVNCITAPVTFTITVNPTTGPLITSTGNPSSLSTTYGAASSSTSFMVSGANTTAGILVTPPAGFEVSLDDNNFSSTVSIPGSGTIAATKVYIRFKNTANADTYSGSNIILSSPGATDVSITMPTSTVSPFPISINIFAEIDYGDVLNDMTLTSSNFDFSIVNSGLKNDEKATALDITLTAGNTGRDPVGVYSNAIHPSNIRGTNGFLVSNYAFNFIAGPITIYPAPIVITANNVTKPLGNTLITGVSTTGFTVTGLQNDEKINSVTITYGNGAAASAAPGIYNGSVVASAAVGGNGYLATNYTITYLPANIIVASASPSITTSGTLQSLTTVYGIPSSYTSFTVSGDNLTAGIIITPPAGFEISTDNITYNSTITIGSTGTVTSVPVYIRLKGNTIVGSYAGNINLKSTGAVDFAQTMPTSTVTPAPLTATADNKSKLYNDPNPPLTLTYTGFVNGDGAAQLTTRSVATTTATQGSDVGTYPITVSGGSSPNYTLSYVDGTLTVYKDISIPNAFTPNGDGINDRWSISNLNPNLKITVEIMNRYGARVYYSIGNSVSWDGYSNGAPVPFGVYYYVIKGVKEKPLSGYVTVVR